jgi:hypothetical protein
MQLKPFLFPVHTDTQLLISLYEMCLGKILTLKYIPAQPSGAHSLLRGSVESPRAPMVRETRNVLVVTLMQLGFEISNSCPQVTSGLVS